MPKILSLQYGLLSGSPRTTAIVAMPGAQLLDVAGPSDVFTYANNMLAANSPKGTARPYQLTLLAATDPPQVTTSSGITLITNGTVQDWPRPIDTLLVAGSPLAAIEDLPTSYADFICS